MKLPLLNSFLWAAKNAAHWFSGTKNRPGFLRFIINIYFISRSVLMPAKVWLERTALWVVALIQIGVLVILFFAMGWACTVYHAPKKFIPQLQLMMMGGGGGRGWWRTKLRYDDWYQRLIRGPKITLRVGPLYEITYWSAVEVNFLIPWGHSHMRYCSG